MTKLKMYEIFSGEVKAEIRLLQFQVLLALHPVTENESKSPDQVNKVPFMISEILYKCASFEVTTDVVLIKDSQPTLKQLTLLEVGDQNLKIIETICSEWKTIGALMDFDDNGIKIANIQQETTSTNECLTKVLRLWLNGESRNYRPASWKTLTILIKDCGHSTLAKKLELCME